MKNSGKITKVKRRQAIIRLRKNNHLKKTKYDTIAIPKLPAMDRKETDIYVNKLLKPVQVDVVCIKGQ